MTINTPLKAQVLAAFVKEGASLEDLARATGIPIHDGCLVVGHVVEHEYDPDEELDYSFSGPLEEEANFLAGLETSYERPCASVTLHRYAVSPKGEVIHTSASRYAEEPGIGA